MEKHGKIIDYIRTSAKAKGFSEQGVEFLVRTALRESSYDVNAINRKTNASGIFQFLRSTWKVYAERHPTEIKPDGIFDHKQQVAAAIYVTKDNENAIKKSFGSMHLTLPNIYLTHFLGEDGGVKILKELEKNPDKPIKELLSKIIIKKMPI